jgi:hypothetical protein
MHYALLIFCAALGLNIGLAHASELIPNDVMHNNITQAIHKIDDDLGTNLTSYANTCKANTEAVKEFREGYGIPKTGFFRIPSGLEVTAAMMMKKWHRECHWSVDLIAATIPSETLEAIDVNNPPRDILEGLELESVRKCEDYFFINYKTKDLVRVSIDVPSLQKTLDSYINPDLIKVLGENGPLHNDPIDISKWTCDCTPSSGLIFPD